MEIPEKPIQNQALSALLFVCRHVIGREVGDLGEVVRARNKTFVRDGKGAKDRITMLAESLKAPLQNHLKKPKAIHERHLAEGWGRVQPEFAARLMDYGAIAGVSIPIRIGPHDKPLYGVEAAETKGLVAAR